MLRNIHVHHGPMFVKRTTFVLMAAVVVLVVSMFGCRDELGTDLDTNLPPDTYITGAPAESTTAFYKVHLFWYGDDTDGVVVGYEYVITDSMPADEDTLTYAYTTRTDSIFAFPVEANQQVVGHRFYVRAIDDQGAEDPEPAITFFGVADLIAPTPVFEVARAYDPDSPDVFRDITSENPVVPTDTINAGWDVHFEWSGFDADSMITETGEKIRAGEVMQYEYLLRGRDSAPLLVSRDDTTATYDDLGNGVYVFQLRAVDDAGFMGLDPKQRSFVWNYDPQTYFFDPRGDDLRPRVIATSEDAWEGELEFFAGDTIPMSGRHTSSSSRVHKVDIRFELWGVDPDDELEVGVSRFQYRKGVARYETATNNPEYDPTDPEERAYAAFIELEDQTTTSISLYVRCFDGYGQPDGSAAIFPLYINRGPILLDTLAVVGGEPVMQYPSRFEPIPMDSVRAWGNRIPIRLKASDPDSTTHFFKYQLVISPSGGALYGPESDDTDEIFETWLDLPYDISMASDTLLIRVKEQVRNDKGVRFSDKKIPLIFTDN